MPFLGGPYQAWGQALGTRSLVFWLMSRRSLISARSGIGWLGTVLKIGLLSSPGLRWLWDARLDASRKFQTNLWHLVKICDFRVMTSNSWRSIVNYGYWASRCFTTRDPFLTHGTYIVEQQPPALFAWSKQTDMGREKGKNLFLFTALEMPE